MNTMKITNKIFSISMHSPFKMPGVQSNMAACVCCVLIILIQAIITSLYIDALFGGIINSL